MLNLLAPPAGTPGWGTPRRWGVFAVGFTSLIVGIAMSITAALGVGSWQVLETGLMHVSGASFGVVGAAEAFVALAIAWIFLGQRPWIATLLLGAGGVWISVLLDLMSTPATLTGQIALLAVAMPLLAVGVAFYLASDLGASAQDAIFVGIYMRYPVRPGIVRFVMDGSLVLVGILLGGQFGIGTLVVTVVVPLLIEPALRLGHRLADTPMPGALVAAPPLAAADLGAVEVGAGEQA